MLYIYNYIIYINYIYDYYIYIIISSSKFLYVTFLYVCHNLLTLKYSHVELTLYLLVNFEWTFRRTYNYINIIIIIIIYVNNITVNITIKIISLCEKPLKINIITYLNYHYTFIVNVQLKSMFLLRLHLITAETID